MSLLTLIYIWLGLTEVSPLQVFWGTWADRDFSIWWCCILWCFGIGHSKGRESLENPKLLIREVIHFCSQFTGKLWPQHKLQGILGNFQAKGKESTMVKTSNLITFYSLNIQFLLLPTHNTYSATQMETAWISFNQCQNLKVQRV